MGIKASLISKKRTSHCIWLWHLARKHSSVLIVNKSVNTHSRSHGLRLFFVWQAGLTTKQILRLYLNDVMICAHNVGQTTAGTTLNLSDEWENTKLISLACKQGFIVLGLGLHWRFYYGFLTRKSPEIFSKPTDDRLSRNYRMSIDDLPYGASGGIFLERILDIEITLLR